MAAWLDASGKLKLEEIHRFDNEPVHEGETLCWDFDRLIDDIFKGLEMAFVMARDAGRPVISIGIDSWGVDFGLVDGDGHLTGPIVHYRDSRTNGCMEEVFDTVSRQEIFTRTGIQFLPFNTIYQLYALKKSDPDQLQRARHFMMIADLVAWRLTGIITNERTNASTTQLFDANLGDWSTELITALDLPTEIFSTTRQPGESIGSLTDDLARQWNAEPDVTVIAVATHDTGSAVAAVPATTDKFAYLSCGTWSLLGTENQTPVLGNEALDANFTNESGAYGSFRLLKNIMGLWILQECRREWYRQGKHYHWPALERLAQEAGDCGTGIDVDDPRFLSPGDMPQRIRELCTERGLPVPATDGAVVRCVLRSLASRYSQVLAATENLTGEKYDSLYIVGGGVQNWLLCKWTAQAIKRPVWAGPAEATVLGNVGLQMISHGWIPDLPELRKCIHKSFRPQRFT